MVKPSVILSWTALALGLGEATAPTTASTAAKFIPIPINRAARDDRALSSRAASSYIQQHVDGNGTDQAYGYYVNVGIGTPLQNVSLWLDINSGYTWVLSNDSVNCESKFRYAICDTAAFAADKSSTYAENSEDGLNVTYLTFTEPMTGSIFTDNLSLNNAAITLQMGLADEVEVPPTLGLGLYTVNHTDKTPKTFLDEMVSQGRINKRAYSLYLDVSSNEGTLILGGLDTDKYVGNLVTVPLDIVQSPVIWDERTGGFTSMTVYLSALTVFSADGSVAYTDQVSESAYLSITDEISLLPDTFIDPITQAFNIIPIPNTLGFYYVNCDYLSNSNASLEFQFGSSSGGPVIRIPISELVLNEAESYIEENLAANKSAVPPFDNTCVFASRFISPSETLETYVLGRAFQRSAYFVFDLDEMQLGLAQLNTAISAGTNIIEINATTTLTTSGDNSTGTATSSSSSDSAASSTNTARSVDWLVAIITVVTGVWVTFGGMCIVF